MEKPVTGGCACGAVRYEVNRAPFDTGWCHCRVCQRVSGAPAVAFSTVAAGDFAIVQGTEQVGTFRSTPFGRRRFCRECGTSITVEVDFQPDMIDIAVGTLDDPDAAAPNYHIFRASKVAWFETADDLPRHDRFRPNTRGLEGTEPPDG